jgi:hypothetical protein
MSNAPADRAKRSLEERAKAAVKKQNSGQPLTARDKKDIARYREQHEESLRAQHYATVPKKHFCEMAARQHKLVDDLHRNYGAPVSGKEVDFYRFVRWVFDFIAENGRKLLKPEDGDDLLSGEETPELEKLRRVSREIKEHELGELRRQLLQRNKVHDGLTKVAASLRNCGDALQKQFGPDALDLLHQHLDEIEAEILAICGPDQPGEAGGSE